jgi:protein-tyrosine-phosphatase
VWQQLAGTPAVPAGTHPADRVHPGAVAAAKRAGLDLEWLHWSIPDPVPDGRAPAFDAVVSELRDRIGAVVEVTTT